MLGTKNCKLDLCFRSNVLGTQFTLYDGGENPRKSTVIGEGMRQELCAMTYVRSDNLIIVPHFVHIDKCFQFRFYQDTNVLGFKGPRRMTVVLPGIADPKTYKRVELRPISVINNSRNICNSSAAVVVVQYFYICAYFSGERQHN